MQSYVYPAVVTQIAPGDFEVRFPDVPEAITGGPDLQAALREGPDALAAAIEGYLEDDQLPPLPSDPGREAYRVPLDPVLAARVALLHAMADQGVTRAELARRLGTDWKTVNRICTGQDVSAEKAIGALAAVGLEPALHVQPIFSHDAAEELRWRAAYREVNEIIAAQQG